jgi:hypothetical protein
VARVFASAGTFVKTSTCLRVARSPVPGAAGGSISPRRREPYSRSRIAATSRAASSTRSTSIPASMGR